MRAALLLAVVLLLAALFIIMMRRRLPLQHCVVHDLLETLSEVHVLPLIRSGGAGIAVGGLPTVAVAVNRSGGGG